MNFLTAEEEEMLQDAYNTIKSIDSHLSEIHKAVVPDSESESGQAISETPPADEKIDVKPVALETEPVQEILDYTGQLKQISDDLQMQVKINLVIVICIGIVAGLVFGKMMWGKIHAD